MLDQSTPNDGKLYLTTVVLGDLKNKNLIVLKAVLFLVMGILATTLLLIQNPTLLTLTLAVLAIWAFCRAYYFAFYVITSYLDPSYKYAGILSALRHLLSNRPKNK
ncbi:MAG: hypothetical protein AAGD22_01995 [Verrucomicrobiota bacterium]